MLYKGSVESAVVNELAANGFRFVFSSQPTVRPAASSRSHSDLPREHKWNYPMPELTHFFPDGASRIVDVGEKLVTHRMARAEGLVLMQPETLRLLRNREFSKGDVLEVARLAGIMATKRTSDLIPLCHVLPLECVEVQFEFPSEDRVRVDVRVSTEAKTGVEMEALMAVSVSCLTIYDMCKSVDRAMEITDIRLLEKAGGRSGHFLRESASETS